MEKQKNLLVVCTGNSCRSPLVAAYLTKLFGETGISHITIESGGTGKSMHDPIDSPKASLYSRNVAQAHGMDLEQHVPRKINKDMLDRSDLILLMDEMGKQNIAQYGEQYLDKSLVLNVENPYNKEGKDIAKKIELEGDTSQETLQKAMEYQKTYEHMFMDVQTKICEYLEEILNRLR